MPHVPVVSLHIRAHPPQAATLCHSQPPLPFSKLNKQYFYQSTVLLNALRSDGGIVFQENPHQQSHSGHHGGGGCRNVPFSIMDSLWDAYNSGMDNESLITKFVITLPDSANKPQKTIVQQQSAFGMNAPLLLPCNCKSI